MCDIFNELRLKKIEEKLDLCIAGLLVLVESEGINLGCISPSTKKQKQQQVIMFLETGIEAITK